MVGGGIEIRVKWIVKGAVESPFPNVAWNTQELLG